MTQIINSMMIR